MANSNQAIAIGSGANASAVNSVALGQGSVADQANTVSVGAAGNERRITNLAAGFNSTDGVNVSQLTAVQNQSQNQISGLQNQINGLQNEVSTNRTEARRGIAAAAAVGGYMTPSAPGRTTMQVTGGFYRGESAVGFTAAHRLRVAIPVILFGGIAAAGGADYVGKAGVGVEF